jgi:hypothetical protein
LQACTTNVVELTQYRGEDRKGIFYENNLLKEWPENGPALLWEYEGIGNGYGSPIVTADKIFVTGEIDSLGYLFSFDIDGKLLWKKEYAKEWMVNYVGSASTPTIVGNLIYLCSRYGKIVCFEANTGSVKWETNMLENFHGKNTRFGFTQNLLVDENMVYCAPGGKDTNIVALDRFTGETLWINKGAGEIPAYCAPVIIDLATRKLLVTFMEHTLLGLDAKSGELLWTEEQDTACDIHGNSAWFENGHIYYVAGCGNRCVKLKLSADGSTIKQVWKNPEIDNIMGGFIIHEDRLIGAAHRKPKWKTIDTQTGETVDSLKFHRGVTIFADNMLYIYNEKGKMGLVKSHKDSLQLISSFKIEKGTNEHFAHPVINNKVLYVRHGNVLLAYDIGKKI